MRHKDHHLIVFSALAFFFLFCDVYLGHNGRGLSHFFQWLPLAFLPCAAVSALITAYRASEFNQKMFYYVCVLAIILGVGGVYFHFVKLMSSVSGTIQWEVLVRLMRYPPLLAPLAISGVGVMGILICNRRS